MFLSIIIPVYNVEQYLRKCLDSVFSQDCPKKLYEVIVVIDGSPDNSIKIAHEYEVANNNCKVIEQENQGLSGARNTGLWEAQGDYVWFVDSDDWISTGAVSSLHNAIQEIGELDILGFNVIRHKSDGSETKELPLTKRKYAKMYNAVNDGFALCRKMHCGIAQRYIFRKKHLGTYGLEFKQGILYEDTEFIPRAQFFAKRISFIDKNLYYYLIRDTGSITSTVTKRHLLSTQSIIDSIEIFREKYAKSRKEKAFLYDCIQYQCIGLLNASKKDSDAFEQSKIDKKNIKRLLIKSFWKSIVYFSLGKCYRFVMALTK